MKPKHIVIKDEFPYGFWCNRRCSECPIRYLCYTTRAGVLFVDLTTDEQIQNLMSIKDESKTHNNSR